MLSVPQSKIAMSNSRFRVVVAGRRFGKTHLAIRELLHWAAEPRKQVWYIAPSYRQAKQIVWKALKEKLQDLRWAKKINESELTITLVNESVISLKGSDNRDSLRGVGLDGIVMDEFADQDAAAWYEVLRPTLSDKQGRALFIGTPKGMNWAYELYNKAKVEDDWQAFTFTTAQGGNVPLSELEAAKRDLDERTYRQEYEATWEEYRGRIYHAFDRSYNVKTYKEPIQPRDTLYLGIDMNINPMSCVVAIKLPNDVLHIIDEIVLYSSNTYELADEIKARYPNQRIIAFPDPAGYQRKTNAVAGITDINILSNAGFTVQAPKHHTSVRDRINAVNSRLKPASGDVKLYIDPKCKTLITALERHTYKEGTSQPDKSSSYDHINDSCGYLIDALYPIRKDINMPANPQTRRTTGHYLA